MPRFALFALVVFACSQLAASARAEAPPRTVVMVVPAGALPLARRLEQEIQSLGLAVKLVEGAAGATLEQEALAARAFAAIRVTAVEGGDVDMTIVDATSGKTTNWKLVGTKSPEPATAELLPTRMVELLRASLLELAAARPQPSRVAVEPVAKQVTPASQERSSSLSLMSGPAALYTARFRPAAQLQTTLTWQPWPGVGLSGSALLPLTSARLTSPQGSVDLHASLFRLGPVLDVGRATAPVSARLGVGLQLDHLRFAGDASTPYRGVTETRTAWSTFASASPRFRVARSLHVVTELAVGVASPKTSVRLAGREVAAWGRPFGTALVGLELTWLPRAASEAP